MKVTITARKFKAREELKDFILAEVDSLDKFQDEILDMEVILSFQHQKGSIKIAELIVKIPGQILTSSDESEEFEISVRGAVNKMERQLQKIKSKRTEHFPAPLPPEQLEPEIESDND